MAFGKLTVRAGSGEVFDYELVKPTTSIGRQPGNDVVLNTTAASRYHAQVVAAEGQVFIVDLETSNGTFVNDRQLKPGVQQPLNDGDVIALGDMMLTFSLPEQRLRSDIHLLPDVTTIEDPTVPFRLMVDDPRQLVAPGARMQIILLIENPSAQELPVVIVLDGMTASWAKTNWRELTVPPGEQVEVAVTVQPPRATDTRPGRYPLVIRVALGDDPNQMLEVVREVDVVSYSSLALDARPDERANALFHVALQNQGNIPLEISLGGHDRRRLLSFRTEETRYVLAPGNTMQTIVEVTPKRKFDRRDPDRVPFVVYARSHDASGFVAPVSMTYHYTEPRGASVLGLALGGATVFSILAAVILIVVVGTAYLLGFWPFRQTGAGDTAEVVPTETMIVVQPPVTATETETPSTNPAPPEILELAADRRDVIFGSGGTIVFNWHVVNVQDISLYRSTEGSPLPSPAEGVFEQPVNELRPGKYTLTLVAGTVSQSIDVFVWVSCAVTDSGAAIRTAPDVNAPASLELTDPPPQSVVIMGRTRQWEPGGRWVLVARQIGPAEPSGWMSWDDSGLTCPPDIDPETEFPLREPGG